MNKFNNTIRRLSTGLVTHIADSSVELHKIADSLNKSLGKYDYLVTCYACHCHIGDSTCRICEIRDRQCEAEHRSELRMESAMDDKYSGCR